MRIAIDTGGTFTDCIFIRNGRLEILKLPSTPQNPALSIRQALERIRVYDSEPKIAELSHRRRSSRESATDIELICGTTVGTNALLERRGGTVALVTTEGFEDVLEIGRQTRPKLYDLFADPPPPLVPRERRFGVKERIGPEGEILKRITPAELRRIGRLVKKSGAESVAVCLLFSFVDGVNENKLTRYLEKLGIPVSASYRIFPQFREFERTSTTVVNAYLVPVMSRYLGEISSVANQDASNRRVRKGPRIPVRIMQSSGGIISAEVAAREPVRTVLSGPAGGVLGAQYVAELAGFPRIISFDMGGTSTDVALLEGPLRTSNESIVANLPISVPMLDIHTVGAGGGSIARFDRGGALRVGPESAGADPGPISYGRGENATVTDAHLILGRLGPEGLLAGDFRLDIERTRKWMNRARGTTSSVEAFAQGILDIANATMEKAIRVISIERGHDTRDYTLVAFGGAGGLHACDLAGALEMPAVLIPKFPGGLSALGILRADVSKDFSATLLSPVNPRRADGSILSRAFARLESTGIGEMRKEGFATDQIRTERSLDLRYAGQSFDLNVPAGKDFVARFHIEHERRYGYADSTRAVEIVNVRVRVVGLLAKPKLPRFRRSTPNPRNAIIFTRSVFFGGKTHGSSVYSRGKLHAGNRFRGPAIVTEYSATTVVPPGWDVKVDEFENLILTRKN